jgi:hypothetical protein
MSNHHLHAVPDEPGNVDYPVVIPAPGRPSRRHPTPTTLDGAVLRWTLGALGARPWTVLGILAMH